MGLLRQSHTVALAGTQASLELSYPRASGLLVLRLYVCISRTVDHGWL